MRFIEVLHKLLVCAADSETSSARAEAISGALSCLNSISRLQAEELGNESGTLNCPLFVGFEADEDGLTIHSFRIKFVGEICDGPCILLEKGSREVISTI